MDLKPDTSRFLSRPCLFFSLVSFTLSSRQLLPPSRVLYAPSGYIRVFQCRRSLREDFLIYLDDPEISSRSKNGKTSIGSSRERRKYCKRTREGGEGGGGSAFYKHERARPRDASASSASEHLANGRETSTSSYRSERQKAVGYDSRYLALPPHSPRDEKSREYTGAFSFTRGEQFRSARARTLARGRKSARERVGGIYGERGARG